MFGKLMKHEFRATGRAALPLLGAMLALAVLTGMTLRFWEQLHGWQSTAGGAVLILFGMSLFAVAAGGFVILIQRYKQNLFGDEGYLTRTLPVSEHALLLSKLATAVCWYVAAGLLAALSVLLAGALSGELGGNELKAALEAARRYLPRLGAETVVRGALGTFGTLVFVTLLFYAIVTILQNFRKHRFLYYVMFLVVAVVLLRLLGAVNGALTGALAHTASGFPLGLVELYVSDALLYLATWAFLRFRTNLA